MKEKKVGRPPTGKPRKSRIAFYVDPLIATELQAKAAAKGMLVSPFVSGVIEKICRK